jgi:hypothetical protein
MPKRGRGYGGGDQRSNNRKRPCRKIRDLPFKEVAPVESQALFRYEQFLTISTQNLGDSTTFGDVLQRYGKYVFGTKFVGVFMANEIPNNLRQRTPYAIINLDLKHEPGSHWISVAALPPEPPRSERQLLVYDSFGSLNDIPAQILTKYPGSIPTDPDAEQRIDEQNCGARAMAWLMMFECFPVQSVLI